MAMRNPTGRAIYQPNSFGIGPREDPVRGFRSYAAQEVGPKSRLRPESFADHYSQARLFFRSLDPAEQAHLASALVFELSKVGIEAVRTRMLSNLVNVDPDLAKRVGAGLNMPVPKASKAAAPVQDLALSPALRIINGPLEPKDIKGAIIGVLVADGSDAREVDKLKAAIKKAGAVAKVIAPKIGGAEGADGTLIPADGQLAGTPSVTVDAIALVLSQEGCAVLLKEAAAVQFVMDAFGHLKAIGATQEAQPLLDKAGVEPDEGVTDLGGDFIAAAAKRFWDREPKVRMLA